jgi:hypothetical protein
MEDDAMTEAERAALAELFELAEEAIGYTDPHFRAKWGMDATLKRLRKTLLGEPEERPA